MVSCTFQAMSDFYLSLFHLSIKFWGYVISTNLGSELDFKIILLGGDAYTRNEN